MEIQPYLFYNGRAEEAIEFYKTALGAKVEMLMRNKESPDAPPPGMLPPGSEDKVMHATLSIGGKVVMVSDGHCSGQTEFKGFSLSITVPDAATADRYFTALAEDGEVRMPLTKTFFSPRFGMVADKFGVGWMVIVPA
jgi:PhnB protein